MKISIGVVSNPFDKDSIAYDHVKITLNETNVFIIWPVRPRARFHRMRAVRNSARRVGKSRTALLGTRTALWNAILEDFVTSKDPSYLQPEKEIQTTYHTSFCANL